MTAPPVTAAPAGRALCLRWPAGRTLLLAALLLTLLAGLAEGGARLPAVRARLTLTNTDNPNQAFDRLLVELDQHVAATGPLDCLIIGSSLTGAGFSSDEFAAAYPVEAGPAPDCFNFSVGGLVAQQAGPLARLLAAHYHPGRLLYATSPRDYSAHLALTGYQPETDLTRGAWVRYQLGEFTLGGWLIEHSQAYRAMLGLRRWLLARPPSRAPTPTVDLTQPPDPELEAQLFELFADYDLSPAGRAGLAQILSLSSAATHVYIVEMPVHATYAAAFPHGAADIERFRAVVQGATEAAGATFWSADVELAPALGDGDFTDRHHLSPSGRAAFSAWLAAHFAAEAGAP